MKKGLLRYLVFCALGVVAFHDRPKMLLVFIAVYSAACLVTAALHALGYEQVDDPTRRLQLARIQLAGRLTYLAGIPVAVLTMKSLESPGTLSAIGMTMIVVGFAVDLTFWLARGAVGIRRRRDA